MEPTPMHEPYPEHHAPIVRWLTMLAIVALLLIAFFMARDEVAKDDVVPAEDATAAPDESASSIIPSDIEAELQAVRERYARGEISEEEADRQTRNLYSRVPIPPPSSE